MLTAKIDKTLPVVEEVDSIEEFGGEEYVEVDEDADNQPACNNNNNKSE
jgi:hypothetical protein